MLKASVRRERRRNLLVALLFISPILISLALFRVLPAFQIARDSLLQGLPGSMEAPDFVGLENFGTLLQSSSFQNSLKQTLLFNILINPLQVFLALLLAFLLTRNIHFSGLWRSLLLVPVMVPILGSTILWGIALRPTGPINGLIEALGGNAQPFLTSPSQVLWSIMLLASWVGIGYWMLFLIAGINDIPRSLLEASTVDGAGALRQFWHITIPLLRRPLLFVLVADTVSNFVLFAPVQVLTGGGPEGSSNFLLYSAFRTQFQLSDKYLGSAELVVLVLVLVLIVGVQFRLLGREDAK